jgi:hypothetical protein
MNGRHSLISVEQLNEIISRGEQLDVEFKSESRKMAIYGQFANEITVAEEES